MGRIESVVESSSCGESTRFSVFSRSLASRNMRTVICTAPNGANYVFGASVRLLHLVYYPRDGARQKKWWEDIRGERLRYRLF